MRAALASLALLTLAAAGCDRAERRAEQPEAPRPATAPVTRSAAVDPGVTPMAQRVAVLGLLNKRNGIVRDITLRPHRLPRA
jgi:hypothetical protein